MRSLRFIFIALITSLFITSGVFLRRMLAVLLCGVLSFYSTGYCKVLVWDEIATAGEPASSTLGFEISGQIKGKPESTTYIWKDDKLEKTYKYISRVHPVEKINAVNAIKDLKKPAVTKVNNPKNNPPLTYDVSNYKFEAAKYSLQGKFDIESYYPTDSESGVGARISVKYRPAEQDKKYLAGYLTRPHWIQIITDTVQNDGNAFIDIQGQTGDPFYDHNFPYWFGYKAPAGSDFIPGILEHAYFIDEPGKSDRSILHSWKADLYLATVDFNQNVTVYDGISWGWENQREEIQVAQDGCASKENQNSEQCKLTKGFSTNDPHFVTFDGLKYDLQSIGEVILTKSKDGAFEVQARQAPYNSSMAINSAVAVKVGSNRVALYAREFPDGDTSTPLRVNGKPVTIQGDKLTLKGGGEILKQGSNYVISSPRGEKVLVSPSSFGNNAFLNISPFVYNRAGKYSGLLGNVNGNPNDDLQIRGGGNISEIRSTYGDVNKVFNLVGLRLPGALDKGEKVYFDRLYKEFGDSWRVKQDESLFDYQAGKTTENYSDRAFPDQYLTLNMLSPEQIQKARNACTEAKVTEDLMEGCIFDVGFSGFSEFARATAEINGYVNIVNQLFPGLKIPTPERTVNQIIEQVKPKIICLPIIGCH